jgi:hypothetical protein
MRNEEKSILELAAEIRALADASRRPTLQECSHRWEYVPVEYESISGRGTVVQYEGGMNCIKCDQWEDEV